jgi:RNA polymerase sigma factor (sigma-70 family)
VGESFADLYAEHLPAARRVALALVPADAAEDIVAEAFTRVLTRMAAGGGPDGAFRPYLMAAVRNIARDWLAERGRCAPAPIDPRAHRVPGAGELVNAAEELAMTRRAFESLPPRWRAVLWQTEVEGHTPAELAPTAGMTPNAVAQLAARARIGLALAWHRERGTQERITGPAPALVRLAERKYRKVLDTSQADPLSLKSQAEGETPEQGRHTPRPGSGTPKRILHLVQALTTGVRGEMPGERELGATLPQVHRRGHGTVPEGCCTTALVQPLRPGSLRSPSGRLLGSRAHRLTTQERERLPGQVEYLANA